MLSPSYPNGLNIQYKQEHTYTHLSSACPVAFQYVSKPLFLSLLCKEDPCFDHVKCWVSLHRKAGRSTSELIIPAVCSPVVPIHIAPLTTIHGLRSTIGSPRRLWITVRRAQVSIWIVLLATTRPTIVPAYVGRSGTGVPHKRVGLLVDCWALVMGTVAA